MKSSLDNSSVQHSIHRLMLLFVVAICTCRSSDHLTRGAGPKNANTQETAAKGETPSDGPTKSGMSDLDARRRDLRASRAALAATPPVPVQNIDLPFSVSLHEIDIGWPDGAGLQSYAHAVDSKNRWLMLGGMSRGIHGGDENGTFPKDSLNEHIWVVDPKARKTCSLSLDSAKLPRELLDPLRTTNQQSLSHEGVLWIVGGYSGRDGVTYGYLIAVEVEDLIDAIMPSPGKCAKPSALQNYFSWGAESKCEKFDGSGQTGACALTVTGGGMEFIDGKIYLILGQRFAGTYGTKSQQQIYTCLISYFDPPTPNWGGPLLIPPIQKLDLDLGPGGCSKSDYHRRDLNVLPAVYETSTGLREAATILGGVFVPDSLAAHSHPIYLGSRAAQRDVRNEQRIGQYEAASVALYMKSASTLFNVILGGISANYCTKGAPGGQCTWISDNAPEQLDGPPFIADGTIISCKSKGDAGRFTCEDDWQQAYLFRPYGIQPGEPPVLLGAEARFLPYRGQDALRRTRNVVIELPTSGKHTIGYVFGGIEVDLHPYADPFFGNGNHVTSASTRAFEVEVTID